MKARDLKGYKLFMYQMSVKRTTVYWLLLLFCINGLFISVAATGDKILFTEFIVATIINNLALYKSLKQVHDYFLNRSPL